jgi:DTW domain-containing protein YfiP
MLHLALANSQLIDGHDLSHDPRVQALIDDPANHCALLYPGPAALDLSSCSADEARSFTPAGKRLTLFVVDGTWDLARGMINRSHNLKRLPQIRFTPEQPSGYRFRKQPRDFCLSTLEAAHWIIERMATLGIAERPAGDAHHGLLECFHAMVEQQLEYAKRNGLRRTAGMRLAGPPPA